MSLRGHIIERLSFDGRRVFVQNALVSLVELLQAGFDVIAIFFQGT